jgi:hypothetical protein
LNIRETEGVFDSANCKESTSIAALSSHHLRLARAMAFRSR